ncbi:MAG: hypothetical protein ABII64_08480 [Elusimicrobiota bacterium]
MIDKIFELFEKVLFYEHPGNSTGRAPAGSKKMKKVKGLAVLFVLTPSLAFAVFSLLMLFSIPISLAPVENLCAELKVYPKIITPGSPPENEKVFFDFTDFDDPKPTLRIIDITGRKVRDILTLNPQPFSTGWRLTWDGRDENGSLVLPGIYIYQWEEGTKTINGTIVVSR